MGGIDILYNNAGVVSPYRNLGLANNKHIEDATYEMNVNYIGVVRLNNLFIEMLKSKKKGAIINTTSILSLVPSVVEPTYAASKVALHFYTESLRKHLQIINSNVKVYELVPPVVDTDMVVERFAKKMSPETLVNALIDGLKKDKYLIRVGDSKALYFINRISRKKAFKLVNK